MEPALNIKNLSKKLDGKMILDNVSLTVAKGQAVGLVGVNGAGKTSLLKCLSGLWHETSGEIFVNGIPFKKRVHECSRLMGVLIEYPSLFPEMTLRQNIDYFGAFYTNDYKTEAEQLLELLNLKQVSKQKIKTFSSGMKQKSCLLIVLMKKPSILLLDEPTSMLDPKSAAEIREFLNGIKTRENISLLISSHNLPEVENLCDKAVLLDHGKVRGEILLHERNKRVYGFEFENEAAATICFTRSQNYTVVQRGRFLYLTGDSITLKQFLADVNPDFIDMTMYGGLEAAFLKEVEEEDTP